MILQIQRILPYFSFIINLNTGVHMADEQYLIKIADSLARERSDVIVERFVHYIIHDFYRRHRVMPRNCFVFRF